MNPSRRELLLAPSLLAAQPPVRTSAVQVRIALNAYSFNAPLSSGAMALADLVRFCAEQGIDALDATGYYFPGYPAPPAPESLHKLKRQAFVQGVDLIGTGVRNDFTSADAATRQQSVKLVKDWVEVAARLGASIVRVFSGRGVPPGSTFDQVLDWMVPDLESCVEHGRRHGVIIGLQNHDDFLKTGEQTIRVVKAVNSEWLGVILDTGSLRQGDPYAEIERLVPYAVSWQLKESVYSGTREAAVDLRRVKAIIDKSGYRGFVPIETLGPGDPAAKVTKFLSEVRAVFG